eukprot:1276135-Rhodomonas_salina.1
MVGLSMRHEATAHEATAHEATAHGINTRTPPFQTRVGQMPIADVTENIAPRSPVGWGVGGASRSRGLVTWGGRGYHVTWDLYRVWRAGRGG